MAIDLYSKGTTDTLLAAKLDLAGGTMTGGLTLSASGIIFSDATYLTTAPAGSTLAADQLTAGVVTANPTSGPTAAGDVLQYDGTNLIWAAPVASVAWGGITGTLSTQTDLQTELDGKLPLKTVNIQGSNYTLASGDTNNIVDATSGITVTVPQDSTYNFPTGTVILIAGSNGGEVLVPEVVGGSIVPAINGNATSITIGYGLTLFKVGADNWRAI